MKTLTVKDILKMEPCDDYGKDKIKELWAGKESLTQPGPQPGPQPGTQPGTHK